MLCKNCQTIWLYPSNLGTHYFVSPWRLVLNHMFIIPENCHCGRHCSSFIQSSISDFEVWSDDDGTRDRTRLERELLERMFSFAAERNEKCCAFSLANKIESRLIINCATSSCISPAGVICQWCNSQETVKFLRWFDVRWVNFLTEVAVRYRSTVWHTAGPRYDAPHTSIRAGTTAADWDATMQLELYDVWRN